MKQKKIQPRPKITTKKNSAAEPQPHRAAPASSHELCGAPHAAPVAPRLREAPARPLARHGAPHPPPPFLPASSPQRPVFSLSSHTWLVSCGASWWSHLGVTLLAAGKLAGPLPRSLDWALVFAPWWLCCLLQVVCRARALQNAARRARGRRRRARSALG